MQQISLTKRKFLKNGLVFLLTGVTTVSISALSQPAVAKKKKEWTPYESEISIKYILPLNLELSTEQLINSLPYSLETVRHGELRTAIEEIGEDFFIMTRRLMTDSAGGKLTRSYAHHKIAYLEEVTATERIISFTPVETYGKQKSIIGKWTIYLYSLEEITNYLESSRKLFRKTLEINSDYSSESTVANFDRILANQQIDKKFTDRITSKKYDRRYYLTYDEQKAYFFLETYPYRNGSKAVINIDIPVPPASEDHIIDLKQLEEITATLQAELTQIVND